MKYGENIEKLEITGISSDGKSVGRYGDRVVFVLQGAPGDVVDIRVVRKKKRFLEGEIVHFHKRSEDRTDPFCEHFGTCGGCKWQHITYASQLGHKQGLIAHNLKKISKAQLPDISPILGSGKTQYYRNKLEFTFSNQRWLTKEEIGGGSELGRNGLGFHIPRRFDKVLDIEHCWLQRDPSNKIRKAVKVFSEENNLSFFDLKAQEGLTRNLIIRTSGTGGLMVIVQFFHDDKEGINLLMNYIKDSFPEITSLQYIINPKNNETFYDLEVIAFAGSPYIYEEMEGLKFRIGPKSFYQTNSEQAYELYKITRDFAGLTGSELVYDLYTGTGTIANFIAKAAKHVIGVESVEDAIIDARINSEINKITNTTFLTGDMKNMLTNEFVAEHGKPNVIITDPPRIGMHPKVVKMLNRIQAEKIVYISCNPATQARDLELLSKSYDVKAVQPVDMFPHTHHMECIVLLELRK